MAQISSSQKYNEDVISVFLFWEFADIQKHIQTQHKPNDLNSKLGKNRWIVVGV